MNTIMAARLRLMRHALRATSAPLGSVEQADARTSATDARAALSIACGAVVL